MFADLVLYTQPKRPLINPAYDLFAYLNIDAPDLILPATVFDHVQLMLPEKCRNQKFGDDIWEFILWQTEQKGYALVRTIDSNWWYWAILANKYELFRQVFR